MHTQCQPPAPMAVFNDSNRSRTEVVYELSAENCVKSPKMEL